MNYRSWSFTGNAVRLINFVDQGLFSRMRYVAQNFSAKLWHRISFIFARKTYWKWICGFVFFYNLTFSNFNKKRSTDLTECMFIVVILLLYVSTLYLWFCYFNIYTSSVFCYDEHKKKIDIHFSMKLLSWRMSRLFRRLFWIPPCCVFKNGYFIAKAGQFW